MLLQFLAPMGHFPSEEEINLKLFLTEFLGTNNTKRANLDKPHIGNS